MEAASGRRRCCCVGFDGGGGLAWDEYPPRLGSHADGGAAHSNLAAYGAAGCDDCAAHGAADSDLAAYGVAHRGGRLLAEDAQAYLFNSEAGLDAAKTIQRMFEQGCAVEVPTSERFGEETRFANGQVLFVFASSSSLSFYADAVNKAGKFKWDIAMPPYNGKPVVDLYGPNMVVHKTTPEKELAAWLAIRFLSEKTQAAKWSLETGYLPVRKSAKDNMLSGMRADKYYGPVADLYNKLFDWMPYAVTEPPVAGFDSVRYSIDRDVMSKIILDPQADVKALLDAAVSRANDTLK